MNLLIRTAVPGYVPDEQLRTGSLLCTPPFKLKGQFPDLEQPHCSHDEPEDVCLCV